MAGLPRLPRRHDDEAESDHSSSRRENINGFSALGLLNGDTPWWARLLVIVLFYFGVLTILVALLMAMGAGWVPSPLTETHKIAQDLRLHMENARRRDERMGNFLVQICSHTAYTQVQLEACTRIAQETH